MQIIFQFMVVLINHNKKEIRLFFICHFRTNGMEHILAIVWYNIQCIRAQGLEDHRIPARTMTSIFCGKTVFYISIYLTNSKVEQKQSQRTTNKTNIIFFLKWSKKLFLTYCGFVEHFPQSSMLIRIDTYAQLSIFIIKTIIMTHHNYSFAVKPSD